MQTIDDKSACLRMVLSINILFIFGAMKKILLFIFCTEWLVIRAQAQSSADTVFQKV